MGNLEKKLTEELNRFNQISYNSSNLEEQVGGMGNGSGFVDTAGSSERLEKFQIRQQEMAEQEELDIETPDTDNETTDDEFPEMPDPNTDTTDTDTTDTDTTDTDTTDTTVTDTTTDNTTELDVTELVSKQSDTIDVVKDGNEKLDSLMSMLGNMEDKLSGMDSLMNQISNLEKKIEKNRPKTEEEKLKLRKQDSGPYNQTLSDYWDDSQDKFKEQGKEDYVLSSSDVENYSDSDIKKSFDI